MPNGVRLCLNMLRNIISPVKPAYFCCWCKIVSGRTWNALERILKLLVFKMMFGSSSLVSFAPA